MEPYYKSGRVTLYLGDCLEVLPLLEAGSVGAVVTDPPYGMAYQSSRRIDKADRFDKIANDDSPFVWFLPAAFRAGADATCCLCFCRWDSAEAFRDAMGWAGFDVAAQIIWDREHHGMGDLRGTPAPMHDTIWFARHGKYKLPGKRPKSVVRHRRISGDDLDHPNEKPIPLMVELVSDYTTRDAVVLDPFMGSGTTGVAAVKTGRRFIGIELDPHYCEIAKTRIMAAEAEYAASRLVVAA